MCQGDCNDWRKSVPIHFNADEVGGDPSRYQHLPEVESIGEPPEEPVPFPDGEQPPLVAEKDKTEYTHCAYYDGDDCWREPCIDCDINTIPPDERGIHE